MKCAVHWEEAAKMRAELYALFRRPSRGVGRAGGGRIAGKVERYMVVGEAVPAAERQLALRPFGPNRKLFGRFLFHNVFSHVSPIRS